MHKNLGKIFLGIGIAISILSMLNSCRIAKNLPEGQTLLVQNKFVIINKGPSAQRQKIRADVAKIVAQKPNNKVFGFAPVRLWLYYSATKGKKLTKFKQWIIDKVGEAPVIQDSTLLDKSTSQLGNYLFNAGYFHANVKDTVVTKNRKTKVTYTLDTDAPWIIGDVELPKGHNPCDSLVRERRKNSFLRRGERFDVTNLKSERDRIDTELKNNGYFLFSREYITFDLDTASSEKKVNIKIILNQPNDTTIHQQYRINDIYVITDYNLETFTDSTHRDTVTVGDFHFISKKMKFRKGVLMEAIYFKKNDLFSKQKEQRTISHLTNLGVFKYITLDYASAKNREGNYLNCIVKLTPALKHAWGWTAEVNVTDEGLFGTAGSLSYKNKNLTKGADQLLVDASAGIQLRFSKKEKVQIITATASAGVTYYLNKFLIPFRTKLFNRNANPKTRISLAYNFEHRFDFDTNSNVVFLYQLHNFNFSFGYEWYKTKSIHHLLNPISITFYLLPKTGAEFNRRLDSIPILKSSYEEQVILGPNYTFNYTNQKTDKDRVYMKFRTSLETAGNVLYAGFKLASLKDNNDSLFLIAKRPFSQYFRVELDWKNYVRMNNHSMFAIRTFTGVGVPYGNSYALPFIKQFYVGGPNSLRGFLIREVGPGSYTDSKAYDPETGKKSGSVGFFNQTGDIKLETNAEIRFDIYRWLKGAVFVDAGNVWTLRPDTRLNANFEFSRFWKEFAVDAGAGLRLDFNFFVVRFDYGFPLRDPRRVDGKRWQFKDAQAFKNGQFQLAIDYPF